MPNPPTVTGKELNCLSDETYWSLRKRDKQLQDAIIERHNMLKELCK